MENENYDLANFEEEKDSKSKEENVDDNSIFLSYKLTQEEALTCLQHAKIFKTNGRRAQIQTAILGIIAILFFASYIYAHDVNTLVFGIVALVVIAGIWIVPKVYIKKLAHENANGPQITIRIYPEYIAVLNDADEPHLPLNEETRVLCLNDLFILFTGKSQLFAIPKRIITPEKFDEIQKILTSHTRPYEED
ncbi:MAG: YcxB family protein [Bacillota bacterium]|nr:YcxB family protein [Bacillota bacterium]